MIATTALTSDGNLPSCYVYTFNGQVKDGYAGDFAIGCHNKSHGYSFDTRIHGCSVRPIRKPN